jgi:hypothetical protein
VPGARIEAHHRVRAAVAFEVAQHRAAQRRDRAFLTALEFDQQGHPPSDKVEQVAQGGDRLGGAAQRDPRLLRGAAIRHRPGLAGQAVELPVVEHHRAAVERALHVAFDAEPGFDRGGERARRVLDPARTVQAAVRVSDPLQPRDPRRVGRGRKPAIKA